MLQFAQAVGVPLFHAQAVQPVHQVNVLVQSLIIVPYILSTVHQFHQPQPPQPHLLPVQAHQLPHFPPVLVMTQVKFHIAADIHINQPFQPQPPPQPQ